MTDSSSDAGMTEIRNIEPDPETVLVTVDEAEVVYERTNSGNDIVGLLVDDPTLGSFFVAMSTEQATDIARNLAGVVDSIPELRVEWLKRNPR